jgi:hypothetical protein
LFIDLINIVIYWVAPLNKISGYIIKRCLKRRVAALKRLFNRLATPSSKAEGASPSTLVAVIGH